MSGSKALFDADAYRRPQHDQWNEYAAAWHRWGPTLQTRLDGVPQEMLDLARIATGQRVLDITALGDIAGIGCDFRRYFSCKSKELWV